MRMEIKEISVMVIFAGKVSFSAFYYIFSVFILIRAATTNR